MPNEKRPYHLHDMNAFGYILSGAFGFGLGYVLFSKGSFSRAAIDDRRARYDASLKDLEAKEHELSERENVFHKRLEASNFQK